MLISIHTYLNISIVNVFIYCLMFATTAYKMEARLPNANAMLQYRLYVNLVYGMVQMVTFKCQQMKEIVYFH
jgi:hypothetical protein